MSHRAHSLMTKGLCFTTPAYVLDEGLICASAKTVNKIVKDVSGRLLFALKAFALIEELGRMLPSIEGFAASSLFEARLAREVLGSQGHVHMTTPGFRTNEMDAVVECCDFVSFNSLSQWQRLHPNVAGQISCGLRINPQLSFVRDKKYDPCRKHSKLGAPLDQVVSLLKGRDGTLNGVRGIHFHTNCESESFIPLLKTVKHIDRHLSKLLKQVEWVNLGGGYLFEDGCDLDPLFEAVALLKDKYNVEVFIEPGTAIVGDAGTLVASVLDIFESDGKTIAVLDTTVNHLPEVLEFQYRPDVLNDTPGGKFEYILAGCTCLAGDVFGEYRFEEPLSVGSRVVFLGCGAYSLVKAHMFNGVNLPTIYIQRGNGEVEVIRRFGYEDYLSRMGGNISAADRTRNNSSGVTGPQESTVPYSAAMQPVPPAE